MKTRLMTKSALKQIKQPNQTKPDRWNSKTSGGIKNFVRVCVCVCVSVCVCGGGGGGGDDDDECQHIN